VIADAATWVRQRDVCVAASAGNEAMLLQRARPRPARAGVPRSAELSSKREAGRWRAPRLR